MFTDKNPSSHPLPKNRLLIHIGNFPVFAKPHQAGLVKVMAGTESLDATWSAVKHGMLLHQTRGGNFDDSVRPVAALEPG